MSTTVDALSSLSLCTFIWPSPDMRSVVMIDLKYVFMRLILLKDRSALIQLILASQAIIEYTEHHLGTCLPADRPARFPKTGICVCLHRVFQRWHSLTHVSPLTVRSSCAAVKIAVARSSLRSRMWIGRRYCMANLLFPCKSRWSSYASKWSTNGRYNHVDPPVIKCIGSRCIRAVLLSSNKGKRWFNTNGAGHFQGKQCLPYKGVVSFCLHLCLYNLSFHSSLQQIAWSSLKLFGEWHTSRKSNIPELCSTATSVIMKLNCVIAALYALALASLWRAKSSSVRTTVPNAALNVKKASTLAAHRVSHTVLSLVPIFIYVRSSSLSPSNSWNRKRRLSE